MTEQQWLESRDAVAMLDALPRQQRERKLRLFACACCRRIWEQMPREASKQAVEVAEQLADGLATPEEVARARTEAEYTYATLGDESLAEQGNNFSACSAAAAALNTLGPADCFLGTEETDFYTELFYYADNPADVTPDKNVEFAAQATLLRDIFGNPFRPFFLDRAWRTTTAITLARAAYEERLLPGGELDRARLLVLSDALEEAGCTDPDILTHLRGPGVHVRGCWAVDFVLTKE